MKLNKTQKNFRKEIEELERQCKIPDNYRARRQRTVTFEEDSTNWGLWVFSAIIIFYLISGNLNHLKPNDNVNRYLKEFGDINNYLITIVNNVNHGVVDTNALKSLKDVREFLDNVRSRNTEEVIHQHLIVVDRVERYIVNYSNVQRTKQNEMQLDIMLINQDFEELYSKVKDLEAKMKRRSII